MKIRPFVAVAVLAIAAGPLWARGGGGCLARGTPILTPSGQIPVESLRPGDPVFTGDSRHPIGTVQSRVEVEPEEFVVLSVAERTLRVTPEHPVQVERGLFRRADHLVVGDWLWVWKNGILARAALQSVARVRADCRAYNLLVSPGGTYLANGIAIHNKGCFLPDTPILRADGSSVPIRLVRPGDRLLAFREDGAILHATVRDVLIHEVDEFLQITTDRMLLRVTAEHPFYVGSGTFRTAENLRIGDTLFAYDGSALSAQSVTGIRRVQSRTRVYNLQTDFPHTFFANGIAVHNKGGGGCFPDGTLIDAPDGRVPIEELSPGDRVYAFSRHGSRVVTTVQGILAMRSRLLFVPTDRGTLRTTSEHPVQLARGGFVQAGALTVGDAIRHWDGRHVDMAVVQRLTVSNEEVVVFNLQVDTPHTFLADGFVVHNKGGGFSGGGGWHGGSGGSGSYQGSSGGAQLTRADMQRMLIGFFIGIPLGMLGWNLVSDGRLIRGDVIFGIVGALVGALVCLSWIVAAVIIIAIVAFLKGSLSLRDLSLNKKNEDLDYVYDPAAAARKAAKTEKLLEFIAKQDSSMAPETLRQMAGKTFLQLEQCWEARNYDPMKQLLMPDLYVQHTAEIQGLIHNHEINRIADLLIERIDLVGVRYTDNPENREFTALITASARDYYEDDRSHRFLRGDLARARFQEFWTFHFHGGSWLLREVEQSRESDVLKEENFVEMFTDQQIQAVYHEVAGQAGPAGPWLEKEVETKATRIDRLLNYLVQTDKLWDQKLMKERARQVFVDVYRAQENGDPAEVPGDDLFPAVAEHLREQLRNRQVAGASFEFRNLCVRKVELILVRNFDDNVEDEFTVRISAHAQKIVRRGDRILRQDEYVSPFEEYWTFGRLDGQWKLKEVLPPARGARLVGQENVDQGTSREQLEWFYRHTRAG